MDLKILFIDPICPDGHINLNSNFVNWFYELPIKVDYVFKKGYSKKIGVHEADLKLEIASNLFDEKAGTIRFRWNLFRIIKIVKRNFQFEDYDYIFFSCYEEISMYFSNPRGNLVLVNHANIAALNNPIKRFFIKRLAKRSLFIVFHEFIRQRCFVFGIRNVQVESIGLSKPYSKIGSPLLNTSLLSLDSRILNGRFKHLVFIPSGSKYNMSLLSEVTADKDFVSYLKEKQILLVVKDKNLFKIDDNIVVINKFLSEREYQYLFQKSSCLLLIYPESFCYRISAILFECFSNNKLCFLSEIAGFTAFKNFFNYNPFFLNKQSLIDRIDEMLLYPESLMADPFKEREFFTQRFDFLKEATAKP